MLSGLLAWLVDPLGDHGLGMAFLQRVADLLELPNSITEADEFVVKQEARGGGGRRFDVLVERNGIKWLALEVKSKTFGTLKQLQRYAEEVEHVVRVAFDEWAFPDFGRREREEFPLLPFRKVGEVIRSCLIGNSRYRDFLSGISDHLITESQLFSDLEGYYANATRTGPPQSEMGLTLGTRFVNRLFWMWFVAKTRTNYAPKPDHWVVRSESSGVWCAGPKIVVGPDEALTFGHLELVLPGPFRAWIHVELVGSLFGEESERTARAQLRIDSEPSADHRRRVYSEFLKAKQRVSRFGWRVRSHAPRSGGYYSAMTKRLSRRDLRFTELATLVDVELQFRRSKV